jgi:hypothetical protein
MLLIYTYKITPRFIYITKHIFQKMLGIPISYTTEVLDFIKHDGPKLTYTKQALQNEFFIRSHELLFEQGINDHIIKPTLWDEVPCFFSGGEKSSLPYDVFAASFYLLSRYEEYLPHVKDIHGRFPPKESIGYTHGFLQTPVLDIWVQKLFVALKDKFPDLKSTPSIYTYTNLIDVTSSHAFAHRGFIRGVSGFFIDLFGFKFKRIWTRLGVWLQLAKDPYDHFDFLEILLKQYKAQAIFFFQFAPYGPYDKNVSPFNASFKALIKSVADHFQVALAASYESFGKPKVLMEEQKELAQVVNRPILAARMRYNRVDIPVSYRDLVAAEIQNDYSMGYTHELGFRAGTATPFFFYDLYLEVQLPVKIHPFAVHDYALLKEKSALDAIKRMTPLYLSVKLVNAHFNVVFSNELLGGDRADTWEELFQKQLTNFNN